MIHRILKQVRLLPVGLALLAALAMSLLPGGYLPKVAGPCGRELCNCTESICLFSSKHCSDCPDRAVKIVSPKLRWVTVSITSPEGPGRAFQLIFTGMLFEASHSSIIADSNNETLPILHSGFSLATIVPHIDIPPPRAQA